MEKLNLNISIDIPDKWRVASDQEGKEINWEWIKSRVDDSIDEESGACYLEETNERDGKISDTYNSIYVAKGSKLTINYNTIYKDETEYLAKILEEFGKKESRKLEQRIGRYLQCS